MFGSKLTKGQKLQQEIMLLQQQLGYIERNYYIITDQYMEGVYGGDSVGKQQRMLMKERGRVIKRIEKKMKKLHEIGFPM